MKYFVYFFLYLLQIKMFFKYFFNVNGSYGINIVIK